MANQMVELLRRLVRQQTNRLDVKVTNIHGAAQPQITGALTAASCTWLVLDVAGAEMIDLDEFYQRYFLDERHAYQIADAPGGVLDFTETSGGVKLYRGSLTLDETTTFPLTVTVGDLAASVALYIDGVLIRTGIGTLSVTQHFAGGPHLIEILTLAATIEITTPDNIEIDALDERLPQTVWVGITTGYQDLASGVAQDTLSWLVDSRVGGWNVYRRQITDLGYIVAMGTVSASGDFAITLGSDETAGTLAGMDIFAGQRAMGTVLSANYDASTDTTTIRIKLLNGLSDSSQSWLGQMVRTGFATEIARVRRTTSGGVASYTDAQVVAGDEYFYSLQAYGMFDPTLLGPMSIVLSVTAGDITPPGNITIQDFGIPGIGYPQVKDKVARVVYRCPTDEDYAGVKVMARTEITGTVTSYDGADTLTVTIPATADNALVGWTVQLSSGASQGSTRTVTANTATTVTLADGFDSANLPVAADTLNIYTDKNLVTDYGVPGLDDELSFTTQGYGEYQFRSFDLAGNEQTADEAVVWNYTVADDVGVVVNLPPLVSLKELNPTEQLAFFPTGDARGDSRMFAVVVLSASDPMQTDPTEGVIIHYTVRGQATTQLPATTAATAGVVDDPMGVRSRNLLLTRNTYDTTLFFWAEDETGLESEQNTFTVDYDTTPEIVSVEYRDVGNDTLSFTVTVDDDTQSISWWTEPALTADGDPSFATPGTADTSDVKVNEFNIIVRDGTQKVLKIVPWAGAVSTSTSGDIWFKELNRTPRTTVVFESRDASGATSGTTVRANIYVQPNRLPVTTRTLASGAGTTTTVLADAGTPGWMAQAFSYSPLQKRYYFVEILTGAAQGQVRTISTNDTSTLTVTPPFSVAPAGASYRLWNAATIINTTGFAVGTQNPIGDLIVVGTTMFLDRLGTTPVNFSYYSVLTGAVAESLHQAQIDIDSQASCSGFTVVESPPGTVTASVTSFDDDTKYWRLYARKGAWPTLTGNPVVRDPTTLRLNLDDTYLRWEDTPASESFTFSAGAGNWYFLLVPYNSFNEDGDAATVAMALAGPPPVVVIPTYPGAPADPTTTGPVIATSEAVAVGTTETDISWTLANVIDLTGYTINLEAQYDTGAFVVLATGLAPDLAHFAHTTIGTRGTAGTDPWHTWTYKLSLIYGGVVIGLPSFVMKGDYFGTSAPPTAIPAITGMTAVASGNTATVVGWTLVNIPDPTGYTLRVFGVKDLSGNIFVDASSGGTLVSVAPDSGTVFDYSSVAASALTYTITDIGSVRAAGSSTGTYHVYTYIIVLMKDGVFTGDDNSLLQVNLGGYFTDTSGSAAIATVTSVNEGGGSGDPTGFGGKYWCSSAIYNAVNWTTTNVTDTAYTINVQSNGVLIASGINPSLGTYQHFIDGFFEATGAGTTTQSWVYTVQLISRADGSVVSTMDASTLSITGRFCMPQ
jgi:hypothetical protein